MNVETKLESLKEELDAAKSNLKDTQSQNDILEVDNKTLKEDIAKLDNKLVEEMNFNKVKTAELEAEQDILKNKIKDKDDLIKKYEKQLQQLREQLAMSVPSDQASTTLILDVDKRRKQRQHSLMLSYQEGLMNRPGGLYRSTSENSLPSEDVSRSNDFSKSHSEHSQFGELLGKELSHGRRSRQTAPKDHIGETVEASTKATTESEPDYAVQIQQRSSTPISDDEDKKSAWRSSDRDPGSQRYGERYREWSSTRDRDRDSTRDRDSSSRDTESSKRRSDRGKERNRADCQQN